MSYFDDASLVMIPSGYKTSKVYSVKPTDGSGDLTFSRSNDTATRVNSAGLIEKVRTNLVTYSNDFSNAAWAKSNFSVTGGQSDPFGGSNAWKAECTSTSGGILQTVAGSGIRVVSIYAKAGNVSTFSLWRGNVVSVGVSFNLANGTIISGVGTITSVGGGWYRCSTFADTADVNPYFNSPSNGDFIYIAFSQLENGDVATDYIATTSAAVSVGPVANVPRLDYLNSSCPRLLLEPQRTNLLTYSEQFANWQNAGGTTTANTAISPSGYQDADTLTGARFQSSFGSNQYTASCFAKKVDGDNKLVLRLDIPSLKFAQFDLATGTIDSVSAGYTATITPYGNGWYRCTITTPASTSISNYVIISASGGASNTYIWGAQLEAGAYATSYIPTLGSASTRGSDDCSKTGISSLIGQTEGTLFIDMEFEGYDNQPKWVAFLGTGADYIGIYTTSDSKFLIEVATSGATQFLNQSYLFSVGQRYKLAVAYKANDFAFYVNGTQVATDTSGTVPATSQFDFQYNTSTNNLTARIYNQALLFKTRLSNADLAALTTI